MKCKPGDLAIIIGVPPELQESLGGLVKVKCASFMAIYDWECIALSQLKAFQGAVVSEVRPGDVVHIPDVCLKPIRGPNTEEHTQQSKEREHETV